MVLDSAQHTRVALSNINKFNNNKQSNGHPVSSLIQNKWVDNLCKYLIIKSNNERKISLCKERCARAKKVGILKPYVIRVKAPDWLTQ